MTNLNSVDYSKQGSNVSELTKAESPALRSLKDGPVDDIPQVRKFETVIERPIELTNAKLPNSVIENTKEQDRASRELKEEADKEASAFKDIAGKLNSDNLKALMDDGLNPGDSKADIIEKSVENFKEHREEKREYTAAEAEHLKESAENARSMGLNDEEREIAEKLEQSGLAVTKENIEKVQGALELAGNAVKNLTDSGKRYLVSENKTQSIINIYMAGHIAGDASSIERSADGDLYTESAENEKVWQEVLPQARNILANEGVPVDDETLGVSKWLFFNDIPINAENIAEALSLNNLKDGVPKDETEVKIVDTIALGEKSYDAIIGDVDERKASYVVNYLSNVNADSIKDITARRKLEEARLALTYESALGMIRKGIDIDLSDLEGLVESLKKTESDYYAGLIENATYDSELSRENEGESPEKVLERPKLSLSDQVALMSKVLTVRNYAVNMPLDSDYMTGAVGESEKSNNTINLERFHEAGLAYEASGTEVRRNLGDSMRKAFRNVDEIISKNGLTPTEANRTAVKMLAMNNADITRASIISMRKSTIIATTALKGLKPATVAGLIKNGRNPLDMSMEELFETVKEINNSAPQSDESYAAYLYKIENRGDITDEERQAYIGIYRLLNKLEQNDGGDIGSVVLAGRELTLRNMLSAVRSRRQLGFDVTVDEDLGELADFTEAANRIDRQIDSAFISDIAAKLNDELSEASEDYLKDQSAELARFMSENSDSTQGLITEGARLTAYNLAALGDIRRGRRSLNAITDNLPDEDLDELSENSENSLAEMDDPEKLASDVEAINGKLSDKADDLAAADNITFDRFAALLAAKRTLALSNVRTRSGKFDIPVFVNDRLANLSVSINEGGNGSDRGSIDISIDDLLNGEFTVNGDTVTGFMASEDENVLQATSGALNLLTENIENSGFQTGEISFHNVKMVQNSGNNVDNKDSNVKTRKLYRAAKVIATFMLGRVRGMAENGTDSMSTVKE